MSYRFNTLQISCVQGKSESIYISREQINHVNLKDKLNAELSADCLKRYKSGIN